VNAIKTALEASSRLRRALIMRHRPAESRCEFQAGGRAAAGVLET